MYNYDITIVHFVDFAHRVNEGHRSAHLMFGIELLKPLDRLNRRNDTGVICLVRRLDSVQSVALEHPMPEICRFYGMSIRMFYNDHQPPHFHVVFGGYEAMVEIKSLKILRGTLPRGAMELLLKWAKAHQFELRTNWKKTQAGIPLERITPLD